MMKKFKGVCPSCHKKCKFIPTTFDASGFSDFYECPICGVRSSFTDIVIETQKFMRKEWDRLRKGYRK